MKSLQLGLNWFPEAPGGLDRFYYELISALPGAGVEAFGWVVGSSSAATETQGRIRALGSASDSVLKRLVSARCAIRSSIAEQHPDVVVSHFALHMFPALLSLKGLPLVIHFHGPWAEESRVEGAGRLSVLGKRMLERAVYCRADRLICLSPAFADILVRDYGISRDRIRVVPGAVDVGRFDIPESRSAARQKLGWPTDRPIVLCVRRLVRRMGLENLVEAAARLRSQAPDALILIAGRGAMADALRQKIAAEGLEQTVQLLGFVSDADLPHAYRAADLTIVPSESLEGFGLVAAESMAAGTPTLVTPVGGLPEVVRGLRPEWVLGGTSTEHLAKGLSAALRGELNTPSARECIDYVRSNFAWPLIAARVRDVYLEALGRSKTSRIGNPVEVS